MEKTVNITRREWMNTAKNEIGPSQKQNGDGLDILFELMKITGSIR